MPSRRRRHEPEHQWPREIIHKLPTKEECCTPEETVFWNQTLQMALAGKRPREIAEFAATGLDDPMLVRAYPSIRVAIRKWAAMGEVWHRWDEPEENYAPKSEVVDDWNEPKELWPTG